MRDGREKCRQVLDGEYNERDAAYNHSYVLKAITKTRLWTQTLISRSYTAEAVVSPLVPGCIHKVGNGVTPMVRLSLGT
jgi:hypothetical protein